MSEDETRRIRMGNSIILRGRDAPIEEEDVCAVYKGSLVAIGDVEKGCFQPRRVLQSPNNAPPPEPSGLTLSLAAHPSGR